MAENMLKPRAEALDTPSGHYAEQGRKRKRAHNTFGDATATLEPEKKYILSEKCVARGKPTRARAAGAGGAPKQGGEAQPGRVSVGGGALRRKARKSGTARQQFYSRRNGPRQSQSRAEPGKKSRQAGQAPGLYTLYLGLRGGGPRRESQVLTAEDGLGKIRIKDAGEFRAMESMIFKFISTQKIQSLRNKAQKSFSAAPKKGARRANARPRKQSIGAPGKAKAPREKKASAKGTALAKRKGRARKKEAEATKKSAFYLRACISLRPSRGNQRGLGFV